MVVTHQRVAIDARSSIESRLPVHAQRSVNRITLRLSTRRCIRRTHHSRTNTADRITLRRIGRMNKFARLAILLSRDMLS
jgi:hypothetical protein